MDVVNLSLPLSLSFSLILSLINMSHSYGILELETQ